MGINQFRPVLLFSAVVCEQVRWSHPPVSILQTRGVGNPPAKYGTPAARLPPKAAKFKRRCRKVTIHGAGSGKFEPSSHREQDRSRETPITAVAAPAGPSQPQASTWPPIRRFDLSRRLGTSGRIWLSTLPRMGRDRADFLLAPCACCPVLPCCP
jgi:hypothetical protein